jgi:sugar lactone lactonase YvrE
VRIRDLLLSCARRGSGRPVAALFLVNGARRGSGRPVAASLFSVAAAALLCSALTPAHAQESNALSFTTRAVTPLAIEGLTTDNAGNVYTTGRATAPTACPVYRIDTRATAPVTPVTIGSIPNTTASPCNPSGIAFDAAGNIYIADAAQGGVIWQLTPSNLNPTTPFATGVPGTNGIAFDRAGRLWTGDGTTGLGRVWVISAAGAVCETSHVNCTEIFRIPPMVNGLGVGRQVATLQWNNPTPNPQPLVANGVAFDRQGNVYVADTARGAIWRVRFDRFGRMLSQMGCDTTYTPNTLCFENVFVQHPLLEGTDGIAVDVWGDIWNATNERNAIVVATSNRQVVQIFRNPPNTKGLRNAADTAEGDRHILELPTSPVFLGSLLCVAQSDGDRRDNSPRAEGQVNGGAGSARGKISCADQSVFIPGLRLPVQ